MEDHSDVDSAAAEHGFLLRFLADREGDRELELEDYQSLYPGHETTIAHKYAEVTGADDAGEDDEAESDWIGRFRIVRELGRGGQGTVYLADDTRLSRRVALKVLQSGFGADAVERLRRFRREAEAASRLEHPNICSVYETGEVDGVAYIAMQYVEGETLREKIEQAKRSKAPSSGPPTLKLDRTPSGDSSTGARVNAVVRLFEELARALHHAHEHGLVHRDVKPGNIMITDEGVPVILDFGLARDELDVQATLTRTGDVLGTPAYMSPEQIQATGERLDRRTDVYSLGASLFECLMLQLPFAAPTREALYRRILTADRSKTTGSTRHVPRDLQVVADAALEVDRTRRYQSALDLAEDLRCVHELRSIRARPPGPVRRLQRWCRRNPAVAVALVLLVGGLAISGYQLRREGRILRTTRALGLASAAAEATQTDPVLGLLLAREAVKIEKRTETVSRLHTALAEVHERAQLVGHGGTTISVPFWDVDFSPDGRFVLTASEDGTARLWDLAGKPVAPPLEHGTEDTPAGQRRVTSARFTPDGRRILTTCGDGIARLWDLEGRKLGELVHGGFLWSAAFAYEHDWVVLAGTADASVWDLETQEEITRRLTGHDAWVTSATFSPDDQRILTGSGYHREVPLSDVFTARLWDLQGNEEPRTLEGHEDSLIDVAFSPDGTRFLTASKDGKVLVWGDDPEPLFAIDHGGALWTAVFSPDGSILTAGKGQATVRLWSTDGEVAWQYTGHAGQVIAAVFSRDGGRVVTASMDMTARVLDAASGGQLVILKGHRAGVLDVAFDPGAGRVATVSLDGTARLWEVDTPELPVLRGHADSVRDVAFSSDGDRMLTASSDKNVCLWSAKGELLLSPPTPHGDQVRSACFSPLDDGLVFTASRDGYIRLWKLQENDLTRVGELILDLRSAAFDGERFLTPGQDGVARLWDLDGVLIREFAGTAGQMTSVRFSHDGTMVLTASNDRTARVWDGEGAAEPLAILRGHAQEVQTAVFSPDPDERYVLTASTDRTARLWDWRTEEMVQEFRGHEGALSSAMFSPHGSRVLTVSQDRTARLWDLEGTEVARFELARFEGANTVTSAAFFPDGERILVGYSDGTARIWLVDTDDALELAAHLAFRRFTEAERERYRDLLPPSGR